MEGPEDGERRMAEEGEKEVGLKLYGQICEVREQGGKGEESCERQVGLERRLWEWRASAAWRRRGPDILRRRGSVW